MTKMQYKVIHTLYIKNNTILTFIPIQNDIQLNGFIIDSGGRRYEVIGIELIRRVNDFSVKTSSILVKGMFNASEFD